MARTNGKTHGRAKRRERPLGAAIGWGLVVTFGAGLVILLVLRSLPGSVITHLFQLSLHAASPTLRGDPLYQQYSDQLDELDALLGTPLSLLCGGLTLGRLAPRYATRRRVLLSGAAMAFGINVVTLAFTWLSAVIEQNRINHREGGYIYPITAPLDLIVRQIVFILVWTGVCAFGAWLGLRWRDRKVA